jgi:hypothetical protein
MTQSFKKIPCLQKLITYALIGTKIRKTSPQWIKFKIWKRGDIMCKKYEEKKFFFQMTYGVRGKPRKGAQYSAIICYSKEN